MIMKLEFQKSAADAAVFHRHRADGFSSITATIDDLTIAVAQESIL